MLYHLTNHCTLNCPHCLVDAAPNNKHATKETTRAFIDFALDMDANRIGIAGGEPTQHPDFFDHLTMIMNELKGRTIILMSNGRFLINKKFTKRLATIQKKSSFLIQISALKGIYPKRQATVTTFRRRAHYFKPDSIHLVEEITAMSDVGRAKGKDWSHLGELYQRKAPGCFNIFSVSRHAMTLRDIIALHEGATNDFCKPLIFWNGDLHVGEHDKCVKAGNILTDTQEQIYNTIRSEKPCGHCGDTLPPGIDIFGYTTLEREI